MKLNALGVELSGRPNSSSWFWAWMAAPLLSLSCSDGFWEEGETFFYQVETPAGTSYLLGTTHVGVSFDDLPAYVQGRLDEVNAVGFETEPSAPIDDEQLFELGLIPRFEPILSQRVPAEVWPRLVEALASRIDEVRLRRFKPWLARFVLGLTFIDGLPRLESEIEVVAKDRDKTTFALETQREQLEVLASIPEEEILPQLVLMATDPEGARAQLEELFDAYRVADAATFERVFLQPADAQEVELLIRERNRRWVEPIKSRMMTEPSLIAVGCAHLIGPDGLIVLLEEAGLVLSPSAAH